MENINENALNEAIAERKRFEVEEKIAKKLEEIIAIMDEYASPSSIHYLSIAIVDKNITFNDAFWDKDKEYPINGWKPREGELTHSELWEDEEDEEE